MDKNTDSKINTKQNVILDKTAALVVIKKNATMQEIADYAGIGIATLHRHFESREKLMFAVSLRAITLVSHALRELQVDPSNPFETMTQILGELIPLGDKIYFLFDETLFCSDPALLAAQAKIEAPIIELIQKWQEDGVLRRDMPRDWILIVMNNLLFVTWQAIYDGKIARKAATELLAQTILNGFSSQK